MDLSPDTVLQLTPGIRTRLDATGHVMVDSIVGTIVDIGPRGFDILSRFSQPTRLGDAIDSLERDQDRATDLAPTLSVVNMLIEEGALVSRNSQSSLTSGWADPVELGKAFVWLASQPPARFSGLRFDAGPIADAITCGGWDFEFAPHKVTMYPQDLVARQEWMNTWT